MNKEVKDIGSVVPMLSPERVADIKREIKREMDKLPAEREPFNCAFNRIAKETSLTNEELELVTTVSVKTIYRYRGKSNSSIPQTETLIKLCIGMRLHRVQIDYLFGLAGYQIKLNDPNYDVYQFYFDYCAVRKDLTVESLLEKLSLSEKE